MRRLKYLLFLLFTIIGGEIMAIDVNTVLELQNKIKTEPSGTTFTLTDAFVSDFQSGLNTISLPALPVNVDVVIDGNGKILPGIGKKHFSGVAGNAGSYSIKNIHLNGGIDASNKGLGGISLSSGNWSIDNVTFAFQKGDILKGNYSFLEVKNSKFLDIEGRAIEATVNTMIDNCLFKDLSMIGGMGAGIHWASGDLTVKRSSFIDIAVRNAAGYNGGAAISAHKKYTSGVLNVENCYFARNSVDKYGAAIGFYYTVGTFNIVNSYFEENEIFQNDKNGDGGAIGIFNVIATHGDVNISGCTFANNKATDDGAAVFIEGNQTMTGSIENSTFVGNVGLNNYTSDGGGAVQLSLAVNVSFTNNTFYNNEKVGYRGGAIGYHSGLVGSTIAVPRASLKNNLFVANKATGTGMDKYQNVYLLSYMTNEGGNVGLDNGTSLAPFTQLTPMTALGSNDPQLIDSEIETGCDNYTKNISTLLIAPWINSSIEATTTYPIYANERATTTAPAIDQRGFTRNSLYDAGSVEIQWVKLDANGGSWSEVTSTGYKNSIYYLEADNITSFWPSQYLLVNKAGDVNLGDIDGLPVNSSNKNPLRWNTIPDGSGTDFMLTDVLHGVVENIVLYAIWPTDVPQFTVTYHPNGGGGVSQTLNCETDSSHTILNYDDVLLLFTPPSYYHVFTGWNTSADGTGIAYLPNSLEIFTSDVELYAQWQDIRPFLHTVTYHPNGGIGTSKMFYCDMDGSHTILNYTDSQIDFNPPSPNHVFSGWNTQSDGNGMVYVPNRVEVFTTDVDLYAQWLDKTPIAGIKLHDMGPICPNETELKISYDILYHEYPMEYMIVFNETAKNAGFKDITVYTQLPEKYITVSMPKGIAKGKYSGVIILRSVDNPSLISEYPFEVDILGSIVITKQPESNIFGCSGGNFNLSVEAQGDILSYQWYHNEQIIPGATSNSYGNTLSKGTEGIYYVKITGTCDIISSDKALVIMFDDTKITREPQSIMACSGDNFTITVAAKGENLTYQWYYNDQKIEGATKDSYSGIVSASKNGSYHVVVFGTCGQAISKKVTVGVYTKTEITVQPGSDSDIYGCTTDRFSLSVEAIGENLKYQWYHNNQKIKGAVSDSYSNILSNETIGEYYVEVIGACGTVVSEKARIKMNLFTILMKWDDVMYVKNTDNRYIRFQWYKDNLPITQYGTSIYYTDSKGLSGTYFVRAYYADGSYDESCPVEFTSTPKASSTVNVYPNPVQKSGMLTVENSLNTNTGSSLLELYDFTGRKVYRVISSNKIISIPVNVPTGTYLLHVTAPDGKRTVEKILVK